MTTRRGFGGGEIDPFADQCGVERGGNVRAVFVVHQLAEIGETEVCLPVDADWQRRLGGQRQAGGEDDDGVFGTAFRIDGRTNDVYR